MEGLTLINESNSQLVVYPDFIVIDDKIRNDINNLQLITTPSCYANGKQCTQHRCIGFYSDTSEGYRYSGQIIQSQLLSSSDNHPKLKLLSNIMNKVNCELRTNFNGILVNKYRNGLDYISKHSDDESGLSTTNKCVASLSIGATRTFRIRDKSNKIVLDYQHHEGDLLVMSGDFQQHFTHEIPVQSKIIEARTSLTFRMHIV
jgi:alkylated DNA repair dioxygenase AlkB